MSSDRTNLAMLSLVALLLVVQNALPVRAAGVVCDEQALGQIPTLKGSWVSLHSRPPVPHHRNSAWHLHVAAERLCALSTGSPRRRLAQAFLGEYNGVWQLHINTAVL